MICEQRPARGGQSLLALLLPLALCLPLALADRASAGLPRLFDAPWMGFDTGSWGKAFGPRSLAAGDLDGDGHFDVLVGQSHFGYPAVSVLRNLGDGTFDRPMHYRLAIGEVVGQVALADVDGDGDLDALATMPDANGSSSELLLWRGDGRGSLAGPERFATGGGPWGLAVADFNGDGHLDVVTADLGPVGLGQTVSLLLNDGVGGPGSGFLTRLVFEVGSSPRFVEAGDIDGDGWPDLAVARTEANAPVVSVMLNDSSGGFLPPTTLPSGPRGTPVVALGDVDADGDLDIATGWIDIGGIPAGLVRIHRNDGSGSFPFSMSHRLDDWSEDPEDIELADVDGDGDLDIVTANANGRSHEGWRILPSLGDGQFGPARAYPSSQNTEALLVRNVDGDCDLDVLTLAHFSSALTVHRNPGDGHFPLPTLDPVADFAREIDAADVDGDGDIDLLVASGPLEILRNDGTGGFADVEAFVPSGSVSSAKFRDLDGDGHPDILFNRISGGGFAIGLNQGDGTFAPPQTFSLDPCAGDRIDAFDLDADGDLDVAMSGCEQGDQHYLFVARNDGAAGFTAEPRVPTLVPTLGLAAARVDDDEHLDLVAIEGGYGLASYRGDGNLGFGEGLISSAPPYLFVLGHFDDDGIVDAGILIPADSFGSDLVGIARGRGDGSFADPVLVSGSSVLEPLRITTDLDLADVDCDGLPDLVATQYASNDIGVFLGDGLGRVLPHARYGANIDPSASILVDVTGDGLLDLVTSSQEVGPPARGRSLVVMSGTCGAPGIPDEAPERGLPEIDPRSLRVRKLGPMGVDVEVSFEAGRLRPLLEHVNVHRGRIDAFRTPASYDHAPLPTGCGLDASPAVDEAAAGAGTPDWYYLAVRSCDAPAQMFEGPYGDAHDGRSARPRPDSRTASGLECP